MDFKKNMIGVGVKKQKNKKGFSLIEVLVAMAIFTIAIFAIAMAFSRTYYSYRNSRAIEKNLEEAQNSMNEIAKSLRTSSIVGCTAGASLAIPCGSAGAVSQWVRIYDYSQRSCVDYRINSGTVQQASVVGDTLAGCTARSGSSMVSSPTNLLTGSNEYVVGALFVLPSSSTSVPKVVGKATIFFDICTGTGSCSSSVGDHARIQSSVSLRDYTVSGLQ